ncbi:hypothetical protein PR048_025459 [Dryococelus australis]|uniref:Reverse transcriptase domain-containing protein n=1 Tax=Dryococelus australis TaxID=614101 RepID=A0ABQ9GRE5_9NEOP|nr:hypothetical protein PR048_025459 [Dryococelus australis]
MLPNEWVVVRKAARTTQPIMNLNIKTQTTNTYIEQRPRVFLSNMPQHLPPVTTRLDVRPRTKMRLQDVSRNQIIHNVHTRRTLATLQAMLEVSAIVSNAYIGNDSSRNGEAAPRYPVMSNSCIPHGHKSHSGKGLRGINVAGCYSPLLRHCPRPTECSNGANCGLFHDSQLLLRPLCRLLADARRTRYGFSSVVARGCSADMLQPAYRNNPSGMHEEWGYATFSFQHGAAEKRSIQRRNGAAVTLMWAYRLLDWLHEAIRGRAIRLIGYRILRRVSWPVGLPAVNLLVPRYLGQSRQQKLRNTRQHVVRGLSTFAANNPQDSFRRAARRFPTQHSTYSDGAIRWARSIAGVGGGKLEIPEKARRHESHSRTSGVTRPGIEPGSPWWEASGLTTQPPRQHRHVVTSRPADMHKRARHYAVLLGRRPPRSTLGRVRRGSQRDSSTRDTDCPFARGIRQRPLCKQTRGFSDTHVYSPSSADCHFTVLTLIASKIDTENCCTIRVQSWTGDRDEVHFESPKLAVPKLDPRSAAIIEESEIQNHEISSVQHFYIGTKRKLDPGSELGSFDLGSGKMLVQPGISRGNRTKRTTNHIRLRLQDYCTMAYAHAMDILLFQEVTQPQFPYFKNRNMYTKVGTNSRGTCITTRNGYQLANVRTHPSGHIIPGTLLKPLTPSGTEPVQLALCVNIYAPSGAQHKTARTEFFRTEILPFLEGDRTNIIFGGDVNSVLNLLDHRSGLYPTNTALQELATAIQGGDVSVRSYDVIPAAFADHSLVLCTIDCPPRTPVRGRNYWRLHTTLVGQDEVVSDFRQRYADAADWRERCAKPDVRQLFQFHRARCRHEQASVLYFYERALRHLDNTAPTGTNVRDTARRLKEKILHIRRNNMEQHMQFFHACTTLQQERLSIQALASEQKMCAKRHVGAIRTVAGTTLRDPVSIAAAFLDHYSRLYSEQTIDNYAGAPFVHSITNRLSEDSSDLLHCQIMDEEVALIIQHTPEKKPITLLCTDYKILAHLFANRLKHVLSDIVGPEQCCAVRNTSVIQGPAVLRDVHLIDKLTPGPVSLLNIDLEKAFDRLWYVAHLFPMPKATKAQIRRYIGWFMWRGYLFRANREQLLLPADRGGLGLVDLKLKARTLFEKTTIQQFTSENREVTSLHRAVWTNDHILPRHYLQALRGVKQTLVELPAGTLSFLDLTAFPTVRRRAVVWLLMNVIDFTVNTRTPFRLPEFVDRLRRARVDSPVRSPKVVSSCFFLARHLLLTSLLVHADEITMAGRCRHVCPGGPATAESRACRRGDAYVVTRLGNKCKRGDRMREIYGMRERECERQERRWNERMRDKREEGERERNERERGKRKRGREGCNERNIVNEGGKIRDRMRKLKIKKERESME